MQLTLWGFWPETPHLPGTLNLLYPQTDNICCQSFCNLWSTICDANHYVEIRVYNRQHDQKIKSKQNWELTTILGQWSWQYVKLCLSVHTKVINLWLGYPENLRKQNFEMHISNSVFNEIVHKWHNNFFTRKHNNQCCALEINIYLFTSTNFLLANLRYI